MGLAQAILGFPPIIILDEPTVGLDPKQVVEIRDLIRHLAKDHTVILSSHILSEIRAVCDRVLIIRKGRFVVCDTPEDLEEKLCRRLPGTDGKGRAGGGGAVLDRVAGITGPDPAGADGGHSPICHPHGEGHPGGAVLRLCRGGQMPLLELRPRTASLEEVFLDLTDERYAGGRPGGGAVQTSVETGRKGGGRR